MTLADLFSELSDKAFQNPDTGNLFFPAYIFTYDPAKEYEIRDEIGELKNRLIRPDIFQECMVMNIYHEFIKYLKSETMFGETLFELYSKQETEDPTEANKNLKSTARSLEFLKTLDKIISQHFNLPSDNKKVYVLVHGFGSIFPYLRASEFLKRFEECKSGSRYKMVLFYPGNYSNNRFNLFNEINTEGSYEHIYRASLLNKGDKS